MMGGGGGWHPFFHCAILTTHGCQAFSQIFKNAQPDAASSAILQIPFLSVVERQPNAKAHEAYRWNDQHEDASADGLLPFLGSRGGGTAAHGTALAEGRGGPYGKQQREYRGAKFHFTPSSIIRLASGKKKIVIKIRHATTEHIVNHFIRETSYLRCMKNPMMSAALINDKPIRIVNILIGSIF